MGHIPVTGVQHSPDLDRALADIERLQAQVADLQAQNASLRLMVTIANEHLDRAQSALKGEAVGAPDGR